MRAGIGQYERCNENDSSCYLGGILFSGGSGDDSKVTEDDILINCIADALLGAACMGGLNNYLKNQNGKSTDILSKIERDIHYQGYKISNIDVSVITSLPEKEEKVNKIHSNLITMLFLKPDQLNIKFQQNESSDLQNSNKIKLIAIALLENRS